MLNIHLKRFGFDYATMTHNKISKPLDFPVTLDLSPYCDEGSGARYHLYSVIIHNGTVNSGHYYIYIRPHYPSYIPGSGRENEWFCANDEIVMRCDRSDMENEGRRGAYCLYYIRDDCLAEVRAYEERSDELRRRIYYSSVPVSNVTNTCFFATRFAHRRF